MDEQLRALPDNLDKGVLDVAESIPDGRAPKSADATAVLAINNLEVVYSDVMLVLRGVSLEVPSGSIVAILGSNGAGKTTLLRAITALLGVHRGKITKGTIEFQGREIQHAEAPAIVQAGVAQVMEGRRVFAEMTVEENLRAGGLARRDRTGLRDSYQRVLALFPVLADRLSSLAGYLSGGEQQMLAIGQALMADPKLLLLDEPSLGLAATFVPRLRQIILDINHQGTGVLLVEQNANMALSIADHGYVLEMGRIVKEGSAPELLADADIQEFYLGAGEVGRRSFRDVKTYRRKKRWSA
jgi:branched-chain amino acid transport system ATP-binding protein